MKTSLYLTLFFASLSAAACVSDPSDDVAGSSQAIACAADAACPDGLECELEHGVTYCKPHGGDDGTTGAACAVDADCGSGLECELEHGVSYCKPHGGDEPTGVACTTDADCAAGEECDDSDAICKAHGGN